MTKGLHFPSLNLLRAPNDDGTETEAFSAGSGEEYGDAAAFFEKHDSALPQATAESSPPSREKHLSMQIANASIVFIQSIAMRCTRCHRCEGRPSITR